MIVFSAPAPVRSRSLSIVIRALMVYCPAGISMVLPGAARAIASRKEQSPSQTPSKVSSVLVTANSGTGVAVGGTGVDVGGTGVTVGVAVGGTGAAGGGTDVAVGRAGVKEVGAGVAVTVGGAATGEVGD
jgi:hypothetical protein